MTSYLAVEKNGCVAVFLHLPPFPVIIIGYFESLKLLPPLPSLFCSRSDGYYCCWCSLW